MISRMPLSEEQKEEIARHFFALSRPAAIYYLLKKTKPAANLPGLRQAGLVIALVGGIIEEREKTAEVLDTLKPYLAGPEGRELWARQTSRKLIDLETRTAAETGRFLEERRSSGSLLGFDPAQYQGRAESACPVQDAGGGTGRRWMSGWSR